MKRLVAFGCSHTYGHGLKDCFDPVKVMPGKHPSKYAWPSLVAEKMGMECLNISKPGANNKYIWKNILDAELKKDDFVIVSWSYLDRHCIYNNDNEYKELNIWDADKDKTTEIFYKYHHSEYDMYVDLILKANHIQNYLKSKQIRHIQLASPESITNYQTLKLNELTWNNVEFLNTHIAIYRHKFPLALDNRHSGPDAHIFFANKLYKLIQKRCL